jgi:hypothetical protein
MMFILAEIASASASVSTYVPGQADGGVFRFLRTVVISVVAIWLTVRIWKNGRVF